MPEEFPDCDLRHEENGLAISSAEVIKSESTYRDLDVTGTAGCLDDLIAIGRSRRMRLLRLIAGTVAQRLRRGADQDRSS